MIRSFLIFFFCLLLPALSFAEVEVGTKAPNFTATDTHGKTHQLKDFAGKVVVLEWYNKECPFVRKHYDTKNMQSLQKKYTDKGVVWLTMNSSAKGKQGYLTNETGNAVISDEGMMSTALLLDSDGAIGRQYAAKTTPHMFIIDQHGMLVYQGAIDSNSSSRHSTISGAENYVAKSLDSLLSGKSVELASTDPYGCSVKYAS